MIYQFSMPPLLLHAFFSENARYFNNWASQLPEPPEKATYFNFTASHDGIGVRPLEGIVGEEEKEKLFQKVKSLGGMISTKTNADGTTGPYEMNITYFDALRETGISDDRFHHTRFVSSQMIMAAFKGVPAFYIHSLLATENDTTGFEVTQRARSLNRKMWDYDELKNKLNGNTHHRNILQQLLKIINIRKNQPAFHPEAAQKWIDLGHSFIAFFRESDQQQLLHITNMTHCEQSLLIESGHPIKELSSEKEYHAGTNILSVNPFETLWLSCASGKISVKRK
jgi:sucrose phosphorylase